MKDKRILLIDDDAFFGEIVLRRLRKVVPETNIRQVLTCAEALAAVGANEFDVVLLDQKLLDKHGLECLREIRDVTTNVPVIMITGYATKELMESCMQEGADDFVSKDLMDVLLPHVLWSATRRRMAKIRIERELKQKKRQLDLMEEKGQ